VNKTPRVFGNNIRTLSEIYHLYRPKLKIVAELEEMLPVTS